MVKVVIVLLKVFNFRLESGLFVFFKINDILFGKFSFVVVFDGRFVI